MDAMVGQCIRAKQAFARPKLTRAATFGPTKQALPDMVKMGPAWVGWPRAEHSEIKERAQ